jgi:alpha-ketoglutarate-dependent taurine dioxygenase
MNELAEILGDAARSLTGKTKVSHGDFDRDDLLAALRASNLNIIPSSDGEISIVQESGDPTDYSRQSGYFDLHKDGLYYQAPPHFVLLYCEDAGRGDSPTVIVDTRPVVEEIDRRPELQVLKDVELVYQGKRADEHSHPLVEQHPLCDWRILNLGARAYLRPARVPRQGGIIPSLREIMTAMVEVFRLLDEAIVLRHFWKKGDLLLMDNHAFLHGREAEKLDYERKLFRAWFSIPNGGRP